MNGIKDKYGDKDTDKSYSDDLDQYYEEFRFSEPYLSTSTTISSLFYSQNKSSYVKLDLLRNVIENNENSKIILTVYNNKSTVFLNSLSFTLDDKSIENNYNIKLLSNGTIHMAGIRSEIDWEKCLTILGHELIQYDENIFSDDINPCKVSINMINAHFSIISPENIILNQQEIYKIIKELNRDDIICVFPNISIKQLQIIMRAENIKNQSFDKITCTIFTSGKMNISTTYSFDHVNIGVNRIKNFLNKYIDKILLRDNISVAYEMVFLRKRIPYKSIFSPNHILSSEVKYAIDDSEISGKKYLNNILLHQFIKTRSSIKTIKTYSLKFRSIGPKIFKLYIKDNKKKYGYIYIKGIFNLSHNRYKSIHSSIRGILFKYKRNKKKNNLKYENIYRDFSKSEIKAAIKKGIIVDASLIKIKILSGFRNKNEDIDKYIKSNLLQMQTDMFVSGIKLCEFSLMGMEEITLKEYINIIRNDIDVYCGFFCKYYRKNKPSDQIWIYPNYINVRKLLHIIKIKDAIDLKISKMKNILKYDFIYWKLHYIKNKTIIFDKKLFNNETISRMNNFIIQKRNKLSKNNKPNNDK
jgi:hypothetical protein